MLSTVNRVQTNITEMNSRSNIELIKLQKGNVPLFDTLFVYENYPNNNYEDDRLNVKLKKGIEKSDYPLKVIVLEVEQDIHFFLQYAGELFDVNTIDRLLKTFRNLLSKMTKVLDNPELITGKLGHLGSSQLNVRDCRDEFEEVRAKSQLQKNHIILPTTDLEKQLCDIWKELLNIKSVGIKDDFFKLGGNSISVIKLMNVINSKFETKITIADVFVCSTISKMCNRLLNVDSVIQNKNYMLH